MVMQCLFFSNQMTLSPAKYAMSQRITLFFCPSEGCNMRFKSTYGRTQHICAKHPNLGIDEPDSRSDDSDLDTQANTGSLRGHLPIDSSPPSHSCQLDHNEADEQMDIDTDPPPSPIVSDDLLQPPTPVIPAIHSGWHSSSHDRSSDADDIESTGHSRATSPFLDNSSPADTSDESATASGAFTDYHLVLNGKFIYSTPSVLY